MIVTGTVTFSATAPAREFRAWRAAASSFATTYFYGGLNLGTASTAVTATFNAGSIRDGGSEYGFTEQEPGGPS